MPTSTPGATNERDPTHTNQHRRTSTAEILSTINQALCPEAAGFSRIPAGPLVRRLGVAHGDWDDARVDDDEKPDAQQKAIELCDGFTPHDVIGLGALDQEALVGQYEARQALFDYVDALWDKAKADGRDPANDQRFSAVAGLRDLAQELLSNAENAGGGD
jgi:hypothetical protein